jgi:hypothetical protein
MTRGQHRWRQRPRLLRLLGASQPPPPPPSRRRQRLRGSPPLHGGLASVRPLSQPSSGGAHTPRRPVGLGAPPHAVFDALALDKLVRRLASRRHLRKACATSTALVQGLALRLGCGHTGSQRPRGGLRLAPRASHPAALGPPLGLPIACQGQGQGACLTLGHQVGRAVRARATARPQDLCAAPDGLACLRPRALGQGHLRPGAPGRSALGSATGSARPRRHRASAPAHQPRAAQTGQPPLAPGQRERGSGPLSCDPLGRQRQPQRGEHCRPDVHWGASRTRLLTLAQRKPSLVRHTRLRPGAGALDVPPGRGRIIPAHRGLMPCPVARRPAGLVTHTAEATLQPGVRAITTRARLPRGRPQGPKAGGSPRCDLHEAVSAPRAHRTEPDGADPAQAEPVPVPRRRQVLVDQRREMHPLPLLQSERNGIDALREHTLDCIHTQSFTSSPIYLQIWANRK